MLVNGVQISILHLSLSNHVSKRGPWFWTHKRHLISYPHRWALGCLLFSILEKSLCVRCLSGNYRMSNNSWDIRHDIWMKVVKHTAYTIYNCFLISQRILTEHIIVLSKNAWKLQHFIRDTISLINNCLNKFCSWIFCSELSIGDQFQIQLQNIFF